MNSGAHALGGFVVGAGVYYLAAKALGVEPTWGGAIGVGILAVGVAALPDLLEPALHPRHRAFFHSVAFNGAMAYGARRLWQNPAISPGAKLLATTLAGAYMNHSLLDSTTPMGIPIVG